MINEYKSGYTLKEVSEKHKFSVSYVVFILERNGEKTRSRNKYNINLRYFKNIDNENKAYWLGFITADGYISYAYKKYGIIGLELKQSDKTHIEKFAKELNYDGAIKYRKNKKSYYVAIYAPKLVNDLVKLGITNNKSKVVKPCEQIPNELLRHYWRGVFDGDGSISISQKESRMMTLTGNEFMTQGIKSFLLKSGIKTKAKIYKDRNHFSASYGGRWIVTEIINLLYKGANIYLERKMNLATKIINEDIILKKWQGMI